jgi:hypothetical protein
MARSRFAVGFFSSLGAATAGALGTRISALGTTTAVGARCTILGALGAMLGTLATRVGEGLHQRIRRDKHVTALCARSAHVDAESTHFGVKW